MADVSEEYDASKIIFNFAIMAIFTWWVPHVSIEIGKYQDTLLNSPDWQGHKLQEGLKAVRRWSGYAIIGALCVIISLAIMIALTTQNLDHRMYSILQGLSRLLGALTLYVISIFTPKWFGVYFFRGFGLRVEIGNHLKLLRFNVFWGVSRQFARVGFFLLPFFCGVNAATIPSSAAAGLAFGFFVDAFVHYSRRKTEVQRNRIAAVTAIVIAIISGMLFTDGVYYIHLVWGRTDEWELFLVIIISLFGWTFAGIFIHVLLWYNAKWKYALQEKSGESSTRPVVGSSRPRMATSMVSYLPTC